MRLRITQQKKTAIDKPYTAEVLSEDGNVLATSPADAPREAVRMAIDLVIAEIRHLEDQANLNHLLPKREEGL